MDLSNSSLLFPQSQLLVKTPQFRGQHSNQAYYNQVLSSQNTSNHSKREPLLVPQFIVNKQTPRYNDTKDAMIKRYEHTQVGYVIIVAIVATMVAIGIILGNTGVNWIAAAVLVVLAVVLILFRSLTVVISGEELVVQFGPGVIRKRFKLNEIESYEAVRIPWYYGWGIRLTPQGMLFRVSGFDAVQIRLTMGKEYLIGTDVPQELKEAIRQAISYR